MEYNKKKKIAAILGVINYLSQEEESKPKRRYVPTYPHPWAMNGRQTTMRNNNLVQRRFLRR